VLAASATRNTHERALQTTRLTSVRKLNRALCLRELIVCLVMSASEVTEPSTIAWVLSLLSSSSRPRRSYRDRTGH